MDRCDSWSEPPPKDPSEEVKAFWALFKSMPPPETEQVFYVDRVQHTSLEWLLYGGTL